jgi:hypothetical protein
MIGFYLAISYKAIQIYEQERRKAMARLIRRFNRVLIFKSVYLYLQRQLIRWGLLCPSFETNGWHPDISKLGHLNYPNLDMLKYAEGDHWELS